MSDADIEQRKISMVCVDGLRLLMHDLSDRCLVCFILHGAIEADEQPGSFLRDGESDADVRLLNLSLLNVSSWVTQTVHSAGNSLCDDFVGHLFKLCSTESVGLGKR